MRTLIAVMLLVNVAYAELGDIRIVGRASATVAKVRVTLADVADVYSAKAKDDEAIIALRGIVLGASPQPGRVIELSSDDVLSALKAAQVDLTRVGYRLARSTVITRAGRTVGDAEMRASIEQAFVKQGREVVVHAVEVPNPFVVEPGPISLEATLLPGAAKNRAALLMTARGASTETRSKVTAAIEEWREVAVAARNLGRGAIVSPGDVTLARLQSSFIPRDANSHPDSLIGLALQSGIGAGEPFASEKLILPPVITVGSKVTLLVRYQGLEATATGIALNAGAIDERISVRNEASKKIVTGRVIEPGLVLVEESDK